MAVTSLSSDITTTEHHREVEWLQCCHVVEVCSFSTRSRTRQWDILDQRHYAKHVIVTQTTTDPKMIFCLQMSRYDSEDPYGLEERDSLRINGFYYLLIRVKVCIRYLVPIFRQRANRCILDLICSIFILTRTCSQQLNR